MGQNSRSFQLVSNNSIFFPLYFHAESERWWGKRGESEMSWTCWNLLPLYFWDDFDERRSLRELHSLFISYTLPLSLSVFGVWGKCLSLLLFLTPFDFHSILLYRLGEMAYSPIVLDFGVNYVHILLHTHYPNGYKYIENSNHSVQDIPNPHYKKLGKGLEVKLTKLHPLFNSFLIQVLSLANIFDSY